ncbi:MAG: hypothetical protein IJQ39_06190, partial [Thermoguttaceae bacterium]|nr:hypothetical protein [Thermoguttaceae bacterium]
AHTAMRFLFFCRIYSAEKKNLQRQKLFYLKNRTFTITFIDYHYTSEQSERSYALLEVRKSFFAAENASGSRMKSAKRKGELCSRSEKVVDFVKGRL